MASSWQKRLVSLKERAQDSANCDNFEKRVLYSEVELLKMELEELCHVGADIEAAGQTQTQSLTPQKGNAHSDVKGAPVDVQIAKGLETLAQLEDTLKLGFVRRRRQWWDKIDEYTRLLGSLLCLVCFAVVFAPLGLFLRPLDYLLVSLKVLPSQMQLSVLLKRFMGFVILWTSGVVLVMEGLEESNKGFFLSNTCVLCCFSHASTLDAFIIAAVIPVRSYILSKAELFLVPFFSWLLAAFGGVPIDRTNRTHAVKSLKLAAESAQAGDCVAVAPEGTRSTTGQLLAFKKGPFHLWEQLQSPVVPVVIFGAYDLFPPGSTMTLSGRVYVRFLPPVGPLGDHSTANGVAASNRSLSTDKLAASITSGGNSSGTGGMPISDVPSTTHAGTRDLMSRTVRRQMLEALLQAPRDAGGELQWKDRALTCSALVSVYAFSYFSACQAWQLASVYLHLSLLGAFSYGLLLSTVITLAVYVCMVCLLPYREHCLLCCGLCSDSTGSNTTTTSTRNRSDDARVPSATVSTSGSLNTANANAAAVGQQLRATWRDMLFGRWSLRKKGYTQLPGNGNSGGGPDLEGPTSHGVDAPLQGYGTNTSTSTNTRG